MSASKVTSLYFGKLSEHKSLSQSGAVLPDGNVVTVAPEDIPVDLADEAA